MSARPALQARNHEAMTKLRGMAESPELTAEQLNTRLAREVSAVANTMRLIHGGRWSTDVNHDACFVAVSRDWG